MHLDNCVTLSHFVHVATLLPLLQHGRLSSSSPVAPATAAPAAAAAAEAAVRMALLFHDELTYYHAWKIKVPWEDASALLARATMSIFWESITVKCTLCQVQWFHQSVHCLHCLQV